MPPLLLDGSGYCPRRGRISQRARWLARQDVNEWNIAFFREDSCRLGMNISAVLLAGGQSRRMGREKATILFRGKPLWQIQLDLLHKLQPAEIFVSARTDPAWRPPDLTFVPDQPPSRGPLSGLTATLARIRSNHLLVLAIDMPSMNEDHLRYLCDKIEPGRGVLPMMGNRAEPLAAIYPVEARVEFVNALSGADFSMQTLTNQLVKMGALRAIRMSQQEQRFYRNLNEPDDWDDRLAS
jgi:molybdopterin-guanine dinucleotide biosynthesis protein A